MSWLTDRQWFLLAVILYGASTVYSVFLWRKGFRRHDWINYLLLAGGLAFHTVAMFERGFRFDRCPVNNLYEAMTFVAWTIVAADLVISLWPRFSYLGAFASPIIFGIGVFALMPPLDPPYHGTPEFSNGLLSLHAALILLAYGAFGLSSVAGAMYLTQEHDLKFHKLRAVLSMLPAIDRLERTMTRLLWAGFILLSLGLVPSPILMRENLKGHPNVSLLHSLLTDPIILWSALVWAAYLALILMRGRYAQTGHRIALGAIASFAFVLLTFWGINLLSPSHRF